MQGDEKYHLGITPDPRRPIGHPLSHTQNQTKTQSKSPATLLDYQNISCSCLDTNDLKND